MCSQVQVQQQQLETKCQNWRLVSKNRLEIPSGNMKRTILKQKKVQIIISRRATRTLRQSKQQLPFKGPFRNKTEDILETKQGTF